MPIMSEEWQQANQQHKERWFCGHPQAIAFVNELFACVELWDDLIDKDVEIEPERVHQCFMALMLGLPANEWFIANRAHYLPLILAAINGFHDANLLAKSEHQHLRNLAFHLRNLGIEIHIATAFLIGGYAHMRRVSPEIRAFFAFETFEEWEHHG